jgi:hypothetical protein
MLFLAFCAILYMLRIFFNSLVNASLLKQLRAILPPEFGHSSDYFHLLFLGSLMYLTSIRVFRQFRETRLLNTVNSLYTIYIYLPTICTIFFISTCDNKLLHQTAYTVCSDEFLHCQYSCLLVGQWR